MLSSIFKRRANPLESARIAIKGMTCKNCVQTIKKALLTKAGVKQVYIDLKSGIASVTYDPAQTNVPTLYDIIVRKGYFPAEAAE
jgi:copper chaperone CopZ